MPCGIQSLEDRLDQFPWDLCLLGCLLPTLLSGLLSSSRDNSSQILSHATDLAANVAVDMAAPGVDAPLGVGCRAWRLRVHW